MSWTRDSHGEFEDVARAIRRMERQKPEQVEGWARRARRGDSSAERRCVQACARTAVAVARSHRHVAPPMELFEAATSAVFDAIDTWDETDGSFRRHVATVLIDSIQPLLDDGVRVQLLRAATAIHGQSPKPHDETSGRTA